MVMSLLTFHESKIKYSMMHSLTAVLMGSGSFFLKLSKLKKGFLI